MGFSSWINDVGAQQPEHVALVSRESSLNQVGITSGFVNQAHACRKNSRVAYFDFGGNYGLHLVSNRLEPSGG